MSGHRRWFPPALGLRYDLSVMTSFRFPNETDNYRTRRDELLEREVALRAETEAVAELRRSLPLGGRLKEDYGFEQIGDDGKVRAVPFADLFGDHDGLLLYSIMFGPKWDAPCPACTGIVDGINANRVSVEAECALSVVSAAKPEQLRGWSKRRGWSVNYVSAHRNDYLLDYCGYEGAQDPAMVSIMNVFRKTPEGIFHCWGSELVSRPMANGHPRHVDVVWPLWNLLDMTSQGRGEAQVNTQDYEHEYFTKNVLGSQ
jgi:predicted dithiol-disulfide oxidoreductase (DUF899 family)